MKFIKLLFSSMVLLMVCAQVSIGQDECVLYCPPNVTICPSESTNPSVTGMAVVLTGSGTGIGGDGIGPGVNSGSGTLCDQYWMSSSDYVTKNANCPGSLFIQRTWTATHSTTGETMDCVQTINQVDIETPTFSGCPSDIFIEIPIGDCELGETMVSWTPPSAADNCGLAYFNASHYPGSLFTLGKTVVNYEAVDHCGNAVSCSFAVNVSCGSDDGGPGGGNPPVTGPIANCGADSLSNANIHYSFDQCQSNYISGTNQDFSEFTSVINVAGDSECMDLTATGIYRNVPEVFTHSCTAGIYDTPAMCVGVNKSCVYEADSEAAVRFAVHLDPLMGSSRLDHLEFYELAPTNWAFLGGNTGPNDYPTRYAVRILANEVEIFHEFDIPTSQEWSREFFDFSNNPAFEVDTATIFEFELTAYCSILGNSTYSVWDLDALSVNVSCGEPTADDIVHGGILTGGPFEYCPGDGPYLLDEGSIDLMGDSGAQGQWVITNTDGIIIDLPNTPYLVDFNDDLYPNSLIFYVSYNPTITGLTRGYSIYSQVVGCYGISNPLSVNALSSDHCLPENISFEENENENHVLFGFDVYPNPTYNSLTVNISGLNKEYVNYTITDAFGKNIIKSDMQMVHNSDFELDVSHFAAGIYLIKIGDGIQAITKKFIKVE